MCFAVHNLLVPSGHATTTLPDAGICSTIGVNMAELVLSSAEVILNSDFIHVYLITRLISIVCTTLFAQASVYRYE